MLIVVVVKEALVGETETDPVEVAEIDSVTVVERTVAVVNGTVAVAVVSEVALGVSLPKLFMLQPHQLRMQSGHAHEETKHRC